MIEDIKKTLWASADKLRANMDAAEYKHIVLGLIFIKYVSDSFAAHKAELKNRFQDKTDPYYLANADTEALEEELEDRDYYREANVFWVPEEARWEALRAAAKQPDIGKRIDDALVHIEADKVECMIALPGQLFFNTQIPACLWFLTKEKSSRKGEVLFIDARKLGAMISRVQSELTDEVIGRIAQTVSDWRNGSSDYQDTPGYCRSVALSEIAEHGHVLTPGRYVGAEEVEDDDEAFAEKMQALTEKLGEQMAKGSRFWRAQIGSDWIQDEADASGCTFENRPFMKERMTPAQPFSSDGRVTPKGIVSLYLASVPEAAMSEVRPWIQSDVTCSSFKITRDLKIVDCSVHADKNLLGWNAKTQVEIQEAVWADIDRAFSRPVSRDEDALDYIPTQIIAELFKSRGYDGVRYRSALCDGGYNLALFDLNYATFMSSQLFTVKRDILQLFRIVTDHECL